VLRKQPIIRKSKKTKEEASLLRNQLSEVATEQKTKVRVSNKKNEREENSLSTKKRVSVTKYENKDMRETQLLWPYSREY